MMLLVAPSMADTVFLAVIRNINLICDLIYGERVRTKEAANEGSRLVCISVYDCYAIPFLIGDINRVS